MAIPLFVKDKASGTIYLNELKRHVIPHFLVPQDLGNNTGALAVPALGVANCVLAPDQFGPFEGFYLTAMHNGDMTVRINDAAFRRDLMNRDVHIDTIMTPTPGGQNPFILPETLWLEQRHSLVMTFTDLSNAIQAVYPVIHGRRFMLKQAKPGIASRFITRRQLQMRVTTPYFMTTDAAVTLANGAVGTRANMTISQEGHFVAHKVMVVSDGPFNMRVTDGRSGVSLSGTIWPHMFNSVGTSRFPYIFCEPWFIARNSQLVFEFNNLNALGANRIFLTMAGRRVYDETYREIL